MQKLPQLCDIAFGGFNAAHPNMFDKLKLLYVPQVQTTMRLPQDFSGNKFTGYFPQTPQTPYVYTEKGPVIECSGINSINTVRWLLDEPRNEEFSFGNGTTDSPFSLYALCYATGFGANIGGIMAKAETTAAGKLEWIFITTNTGELFGALYDNTGGNSIRTVATSALSTGRWYSLGMTYDGLSVDSGIKLYVNGEFVPQTPMTNGSYTAMHNADNYITAGVVFRGSGSTRRWWKGLFGHSAVWSRELSATEMLLLHNQELGAFVQRTGRRLSMSGAGGPAFKPFWSNQTRSVS